MVCHYEPKHVALTVGADPGFLIGVGGVNLEKKDFPTSTPTHIQEKMGVCGCSGGGLR